MGQETAFQEPSSWNNPRKKLIFQDHASQLSVSPCSEKLSFKDYMDPQHMKQDCFQDDIFTFGAPYEAFFQDHSSLFFL